MTAGPSATPAAHAEAPSRVAVIGVGNHYRADDGLGLVVAERLRPLLPDDVAVHAMRAEVSALFDAWENADAVVLIDAVQGDAPPGTVHRIDASAAPLPTELGTTSTHGLSLPEAIELGRTLEVLPARVIVFGVEGRHYDHRRELSVAVEAAVESVVTDVCAEVERLRAGSDRRQGAR